MALARVNMACGIFSACRDFAHRPLPANFYFYPFKPIMNLSYRISAVAGNPWMAPGKHLRVERRNGIDIAAHVLRVR